MSILRNILTLGLASTMVLTVACASKNSAKKTAAAGTPKTATTKQPVSAPKPTTKAGTNVTTNKTSAVAVEADPDCTKDEEGLAVCSDSFAVFCSDGKVYALDCNAAFGATCGQLDDGSIDCVVEEAE